jgi:hypothetical protein
MRLAANLVHEAEATVNPPLGNRSQYRCEITSNAHPRLRVHLSPGLINPWSRDSFDPAFESQNAGCCFCRPARIPELATVPSEHVTPLRDSLLFAGLPPQRDSHRDGIWTDRFQLDGCSSPGNPVTSVASRRSVWNVVTIAPIRSRKTESRCRRPPVVVPVSTTRVSGRRVGRQIGSSLHFVTFNPLARPETAHRFTKKIF